ncbi:MAG: histidinol-phosphatase HisJ family protein [Spirochaetales bacterium]|nr:histidinol-phosphatase HisJ family protein [Spirochaetales bacterium]
MQIKADIHLHSTFSSDGRNSIKEMAFSAIEKGLEIITFTDHVDFDYPVCPNPATGKVEFFNQLNASEYRNAIEELQQEMSGKIQILIGVETGLQPNNLIHEKTKSFNEKLKPDFIIASTHCACGQILTPYSFFENRTRDEAYRKYLEEVLKNLLMTDDYDTAAHLDFVERYYPAENVEEKLLKYEDFADVIDEILLTLIRKDKALEINTAGIRLGLGVPHPSQRILLRYKELGGKLITIGSDAHRATDIAADFETVAKYLLDAGFKEYCVFENRKPRLLAFGK